MFIGANVNHKNTAKFGTGVITDLEINPEDQLKSKVSVQFNNGAFSKFSIKAFEENGFFTTDDEDIIPFVEKLKVESEEKRKAELKRKAESIVYVPSYDINEYDKEVTKEDWIKAAEVAGNYRFPNESRAVVMDSDLIFINASAAMRYMGSRIKDCDKIYKACENNNKFQGHSWSYASRDAIDHIISLFE